jgi:chromate transporter
MPRHAPRRTGGQASRPRRELPTAMSPTTLRMAFEVFWRFLWLGLTSFGGPVAHLAYFRREFVERRGWLDDATFGEIVAICSALPGPTSSQVGIVIGTRRAGPFGSVAAWLGFTAPSATIMTAFGLALRAAGSGAHVVPAPMLAGAYGGLIGAAGGVVAQAVVALARSLARTRATQAIALIAFGVALLVNRMAPQLQWLPLLVGATLGGAALRVHETLPPARLGIRVPHVVAVACGVALLALLVVLPSLAVPGSPAGLFAIFVRAGALVFGGGHVVLPFLQSLISPDIVPATTFLAGYGAAQAVPGPLFTFASFLGAVNATPTHGAAGAALATAGIFLPSFLLLATALPLWKVLRELPRAQPILSGINASVVGMLAAVLAGPIGGTLLAVPWRGILATLAFVALVRFRAAPWLVVAACTFVGALLGTLR